MAWQGRPQGGAPYHAIVPRAPAVRANYRKVEAPFRRCIMVTIAFECAYVRLKESYSELQKNCPTSCGSSHFSHNMISHRGAYVRLKES